MSAFWLACCSAESPPLLYNASEAKQRVTVAMYLEPLDCAQVSQADMLVDPALFDEPRTHRLDLGDMLALPSPVTPDGAACGAAQLTALPDVPRVLVSWAVEPAEHANELGEDYLHSFQPGLFSLERPARTVRLFGSAGTHIFEP